MHRLLPLLLLPILLVAISRGAGAQAYRPDFDPSAFKGPTTSPPSEVMVLGTAHLRNLKFDPALVQMLNDRLAGWHPDAIAVEQLSGMQCDFMQRSAYRYAKSSKIYCWDTAPARAATGLDVIAATQAWQQLLAKWPATPTPAQRRHLAAVFLAGGEKGSALVQWLRLAPADRHAGDGLDAALVAFLQESAASLNETTLIAATLAARLGHERIYPMDDHTADSSDDADEQAQWAAIKQAWDNPASAQRKRQDEALAANLHQPEDLLALYRAYNAPGQGKLIFTSDFGAAMNEPSPQHFGRGYLAYWETRNLRMASNIRETLGNQPGMRMLVVVGASHKGYLEAYLNEMHDVRIVDTAPLLK